MISFFMPVFHLLLLHFLINQLKALFSRNLQKTLLITVIPSKRQTPLRAIHKDKDFYFKEKKGKVGLYKG